VGIVHKNFTPNRFHPRIPATETRNAQGRVWLTHQATSRTRRVVSLHNEQAKAVLDKRQTAIRKEASATSIKITRKFKLLTKKMCETRFYQASLEQHKKTAQPGIPTSQRIYGDYQGYSHKDLQPLIDKMIAWNQPKAKKDREIHDCLANGQRNGRLVDLDESKVRFERLINRPKPGAPRRQARLRLSPVVVNKTMVKQNTAEQQRALVNLLFLNRSHSVL
jgi:hypothetical protein